MRLRLLPCAAIVCLASSACAGGSARSIAAVRAENMSAAKAALRKRKLTLLPARTPLEGARYDEPAARVAPGSETTYNGKRVIVGTAWGYMVAGPDLLVRDAQGVIHLLLLQRGDPKVKRTVRVKVDQCTECTARQRAVAWWQSAGGCYAGGAAPPPPTLHYYELAAGEQVGPPISIDYAYTELEPRADRMCPPRP